MAGSATIQIFGNLGRDPEVKFLDGGKAVAKFSIAVSTKKDGATSWFNVAVFGKQAELCGQYLKKGRQALVAGRCEIQTYAKKDGTQGTSVEVLADSVTFIGGKDDAPTAATHGVDPDSIPF